MHYTFWSRGSRWASLPSMKFHLSWASGLTLLLSTDSLLFYSVQLVTDLEGVIMTPEILEWKFKKHKSFLLSAAQQMQPTLT